VTIEFREERATDHGSIRTVHEMSFPTAAEAKLVDALRDAGNLTISLVCCDRNSVAGHVVFSPVTVNETATGLGLGPIAVLPQYRRQGIAAELIRAGLKKSKALGYGFVVVLGDPAYYCRFRFDAASNWGLLDEYGGGSAFQALELRDGAIPSSGGKVRYGPEFAIAADAGAT
jgi:putative acetyltransferase